MSFRLIPSLDLLDGKVVRLIEGDFARCQSYGEAGSVVAGWPRGILIHVVDLAASRDGHPVETGLVRLLAGLGFRLQVGGGIRSVEDAQSWIDAGAERVVVGTLASEEPRRFAEVVEQIGAARVVPAVDVLDGEVRVAGWKKRGSRSVDDTLRFVESTGCPEILVTEISRDGKLQGPSFSLYRSLATRTSLRVLASGGVSTRRDVAALARLPNVSGAIVGKAILDKRIGFDATGDVLPPRIVPCLDISNGRVAKGVNFTAMRDAGDPVELATRYEEEGADEIAVLDISATTGDRRTALETVRRIADALFIPLTVGGGVRSVDDFRQLLQAGADRVAINTAAVRDPALLGQAAREFGVQAVVLACDARRGATGFEVMVAAGRQSTGLDATEWCVQAEELGAGEILLTSIDRDGTASGFDLELLRNVSSRLKIGVIASGGGGRPEHFRDAIEEGGASAVLAASIFHDRIVAISEVKKFLLESGIPVRSVSSQ